MKLSRTKSAAAAAMCALCLAGWIQVSGASEETGKIIERLVADVDKQLTSLEELTGKQSAEKARLTSALDQEYARYDALEDNAEKTASRGEIVNLMASLNSADRTEVKATLKTVVGVTEALRKLDQMAKNSAAFNPEKLNQQKVRMSNYVRNAARIVRIMEQANDNPATRNRTVAIKNSLIMLYRQLQDPWVGTANALSRLNETTRTLEDVAVQLHILQGLLEDERNMLLTAAHVQTVDLALLRLARAKLGANSVSDIPGKSHEEIVQRMRRLRNPLNDSTTSLSGSYEPYDSTGWEMLSYDELTTD